MACYNFAAVRFGHDVGECGSCHRRVRLKRGHCRLCWCQAELERDTGPGTPLAPHVRKVRQHQLFLADMARRVAPPPRIVRRRGAKGRPLKPPPAPAGAPRSPGQQLLLFDDVLPCAYAYAQIDLRSGPPPDNPWLDWALYLAHTTAEARGWHPGTRREMQRILVTLLAGYRGDQKIVMSDVHRIAVEHSTNHKHVAEILTAMGLLLDDLPRTFDVWLAAKTEDLPAAIGRDVREWATTLHDGGPRRPARSKQTATHYLNLALPALVQWSAGYDHLRQVTRADVDSYLAALQGDPRTDLLVALRSLFRWAKTKQLIFRNPTARIRGTKPAEALWQPLSADEIRRTIDAASTPAARLCVVLAAVHAARPGQIRAMLLTDVDLPGRRLRVDGKDRPLDELTRQVLLEWLTHRRNRWPGTANPHLLISQRTAVGLGQVSAQSGTLMLRGLPASLERLRINRQLEEAIASGADPLHVAIVFGMESTTAVRYALNAAALLRTPHRDTAPGSSRTPVPEPDDRRGEPLGSR